MTKYFAAFILLIASMASAQTPVTSGVLSPQPVSLSASDAGTCTATSTGCFVFQVRGYAGIAVQVTGNASANTLVFEATTAPVLSSGTAWNLVALLASDTQITATSTAGTGLFFGTVNASYFRVRMSALVSGTAIVTSRAVLSASSGGGAGGGGGGGNVTGTKSNNSVPPGATNLGVLPCLANAAAPSWTEGNQVACSEDLAGNTRVLVSNSSPVDANSYPIVVNSATATATGAALPCNILTTASTNATNCKNAAGNFYGYDITNTTTTVYYLRLYNLAASPTCSSATGFIRSIALPPGASAGLVGGIVSNQDVPVNYSTGISYCVTGGSSSTDNSNAAAGIFGEIRYK